MGVINRIGDTPRQAEGRIKEVAGKVAPAQEADDEGTPGEVRSRAAKESRTRRGTVERPPAR